MNKPLIINRPDLQTLRQQYTFALLTFLFWVAWFYLWLPLISLLAWLFGIEIFYEHMVVLEGLTGFVGMLDWYVLVISALGTVLLCWSWYNLFRFRGKNKRVRKETVSDRQLAGFFNIDIQSLEACRLAQRIEINYDANGQIRIKTCRDTG